MSVTGSAAPTNLNCLKGKLSSLSPYAVDKTLTVEGAGADAKAVGDALATKVGSSAIVDNLTTSKADLPLSANQGVVLKQSINNIKTQVDTDIAEMQVEVTSAKNNAAIAKTAAEEAQAYATSSYTELNVELKKKAETASYYGTLLASGWSETAPYTQTISVEGLLETDDPFVDVYLEDVEDGTAILDAWTLLGRLSVSANDTLTAYCYEEKPNIAIPIILKVVR